MLELWAPIPDRADLLELRLVLDDHRFRIGVLEDVLALLGRVRLVDRNHRCAGGQGSEVEVGPLWPRVAEDRDLVALLDVERYQPERELLDDLADFVIGARAQWPESSLNMTARLEPYLATDLGRRSAIVFEPTPAEAGETVADSMPPAYLSARD